MVNTMSHDTRLHLIHPVPLPDLLRAGDVTHDDGVILVQLWNVQHTLATRHVHGPKIVRLQDSKTPVEVRLLFITQSSKVSDP